MSTLETMTLHTVEPNEMRLHLVPTYKSVTQHCIQDVLRDYADVADWCTHFYGVNGAAAYDMPEYQFAKSLLSIFANCIRNNI